MQYPSKSTQQVFDIIADRAIVSNWLLKTNNASEFIEVDTELLASLCSGLLSLTETEMAHRVRFTEHLFDGGMH